MKPRSTLVAPAAIACAACVVPHAASAAPAAAVTEAEAEQLADATVVVRTSTDAARIKAFYAPSVIGFDFAVGPLSTDRATWDRAQDAYAAAGLDSAVRKARKIRLPGPDAFVVSGVWDVRSSTIPADHATVRCTDMYRRDAHGAWPIVNEHCSAMPTPA